jgi:RNA polymerase sigma-70 factor (ECF subfamily)
VDEASRLLLEARSEPASFAAFVRATQPEIWRFCRGRLGFAEADDATQEVYLAAWRALPAYRGEASARTWLFVIARRVTDRTAARRRRWRELAGGLDAPPPPSRPDDSAELGDQLVGMNEDRKVALLLTQVVGLTYAEAAVVCECSVGTIRSRVARGRAELLSARTRTEGLGEVS